MFLCKHPFSVPLERVAGLAKDKQINMEPPKFVYLLLQGAAPREIADSRQLPNPQTGYDGDSDKDVRPKLILKVGASHL